MTIKLYWWQGEGSNDSSKQNFGDFLSPLIVGMLSGKKVVYAEPKDADMIAIGSILSRERKAKGLFRKRTLHIWGSGTDKAARTFGGHHVYHAVRGAITRSQISNLRQTPALGDPGLLVEQLYEGRIGRKTKYRLGIIPHFVDQSDPRVAALLSMPGTTLISVFSPVEQVVREICECEFILSSSMHGLIIADAYGIPNRRMPFSSGIISDLKFDDYYSAFGMDCPTAVTPDEVIRNGFDHPVFSDTYERPGIEDVKIQLARSFPRF